MGIVKLSLSFSYPFNCHFTGVAVDLHLFFLFFRCFFPPGDVDSTFSLVTIFEFFFLNDVVGSTQLLAVPSLLRALLFRQTN